MAFLPQQPMAAAPMMSGPMGSMDASGPLGMAPMAMSSAGPPSNPSSSLPKDKKDREDVAVLAERAQVKRWCSMIDKAKEKWEDDFKRMRDNMDFVASLQYAGQKSISSEDRYICNFTLRVVNQGVALVYAKDPKIEAKRRKRLNYQIWDGHMETIMQAAMTAQMMQMKGMPVPPELFALINDYQQGKLHETLVEKVGKTLEVIFQYQLDTQQPRFKLQMKQLVRRVRTCGVAYIKVLFCREYNSPELTHSETRLSVTDRWQMAKRIFEKYKDGEIDETSADIQKLKELVMSMNVAPLDTEAVEVKEHLIFDFPQATSIIPDPNTRTLKGFVGAHWLVEEMYYPLEFVNAMYELDIDATTEVKFYGQDNKPLSSTNLTPGPDDEDKRKKVCLWNVYDLDSKCTFTLCQGYKDYVMEPETITPSTKGFWNHFAMTFNDIEVEEGCKATIFPPSDVDLIKSPQKEWNRSRQSLRRHRTANSPKYMYPDGALAEEDLDRLAGAEDQQFIKLKGLQPGVQPGEVLQPLKVEPINPLVYETESLREDTLLSTGQQEANIGPAQPNVTATVGNIAEQSRMSVASSDIDGLDDCLTEVAQCGGEMLLREFSVETAKRIAGPGAVWPDQNREDFINELELEVVAASSGRPNKAVDVSNWQQLAPILMQMGANPQAVIRETIRRVDDQMEPSDFFPLPLPTVPSPTGTEPPQPEQDGGAPAGLPGRQPGRLPPGPAQPPVP
jgi:hypothetical protein